MCRGVVCGYARNTKGDSNAAFTFDKPGSYWSGIGSGGENLVRLGACE